MCHKDFDKTSSADLTVTGMNGTRQPLYASFTISVADEQFPLRASSLLIHVGRKHRKQRELCKSASTPVREEHEGRVK